jgi:hypothetical protein
MERSPYYPFPPRPGMKIEIAEMKPNEIGLEMSDEQVNEVINFEHNLYDLELDSELYPSAAAYKLAQTENGNSVPKLESIWSKNINPFSIGINYLLTGDGRQAIGDIAGETPDYRNKEECLEFLSNIDFSEVDSCTLDELENHSIELEEMRLTIAFEENAFKGGYVPSPEIVTIYKNPEAILDKARGYKQIKAYLKLACRDLGNQTNIDPEVKQAQLLVLNLYRAKINRLVAALYIRAETFLAQPAAQSEAGRLMVEELKGVLPAYSRTLDKRRNARFMQTLDEYRHGVSEDETGHYSWLSPEAKKLAEIAIGNSPINEVDRGVYADIDPEDLKSTEVNGQQFADLIRAVLSEYEMLSDYTKWDSIREGPAVDGKWQVVVSGKFKSLSVNGKQRIIKVPTASRSLMEALPLASHEITHAIQNENKRAIGDLAILERVGIDAPSEQTESGAKWQERIARETLTGKEDTTVSGLGYLKALEVKASGGGYGECVEVYFKQLLLDRRDMTFNDAAKQAVNRARRIFRDGGLEFAQSTSYVTNTQPLNYLEQELIYRSLDEEDRKFLFVGSVMIDNLKRLAGVGLVDLDKILVPKRKPIEILEPKVRELIAA